MSLQLAVLVFLLPLYFVSSVPRPRPPRRLCGECGREFYSWSFYCSRPACVAARLAHDDGESWRSFRKRVIEGGDNDAA